MLALEDCRRFYAEEIQLAAHLSSRALVEAFARVARENFLGPGPWQVVMPDMLSGTTQYVPTPNADARHVYHNVVIALDRSRDLSNGQPGTLATFIKALELAPGNRVYHLGAGTGYYTAIMAEAVGADGSVVATEVHPELGPAAQKNLAGYPQVTMHATDGSQFDPGECDAILINAGVTHPLPVWLDRLREGGRLVVPITVSLGMGPNLGKGVMLKITRRADNYSAQVVTFVAIYSAIGARDPALEPVLGKALATGALMKVKSVRRDQHAPEESCVVHGQAVCLSLAETASGGTR